MAMASTLPGLLRWLFSVVLGSVAVADVGSLVSAAARTYHAVAFGADVPVTRNTTEALLALADAILLGAAKTARDGAAATDAASNHSWAGATAFALEEDLVLGSPLEPLPLVALTAEQLAKEIQASARQLLCQSLREDPCCPPERTDALRTWA